MFSKNSFLSFILNFFSQFKLWILFVPFLLISLNIGGGLAKLPVEIRSIKIVKEMVETNDLLVPKIDGKPYITKPPLYHWTASFLSHFFGSVSWSSIRMPSLIAAFLMLFIVFLWGKDLGGDHLGILSVFITFSAYLFVVLARRGAPDMIFSASCFACLYIFQKVMKRNNIFLFVSFFLMFSIAFLTKAHVIFLVVVLPILIILLVKKRLRRIFSFDIMFLSLITLLISVSWYSLLYLWNPDEAMYWFLLEGGQPFDLKIVGETARHFKPFYYYFFRIWDLFLPFSIFIPLTFLFFWKKRKSLFSDEWTFVVSPFVIVFIFFAFIPAKQPHYILPILPLLSLMVGRVILEQTEFTQNNMKKFFYWSTLSYLLVLFVMVLGAAYFIVSFLEYKLVPLLVIIFAIFIYLFCFRLFLQEKIQLSIYFSFVVLSCFFIIFCGYFEEWKSYDRYRKRSQVTFYFSEKKINKDFSFLNYKDCEFIHG